MPKRGRGDTLTGGSGDTNPQTMVLFFQAGTANDTPGVNTIATPIPRLPIHKGKSLVMELLKLKYNIDSFTVAAAATNLFYVNVTTNPTVIASAIAGTGDARVIDDWQFAFISGAANANSLFPMEQIRDLTDDAGHGILVATDALFSNAATLHTGAANFTGQIRITYRFKQVDLEEYIGIVQAQQ